jgi:hypothetical protein
MTALEQAASDSGFQVVSWQAFRGNEPALTYARRSNVDVLFEINRLGPDDSSDGVELTGSVEFFRLFDEKRRQRFPVSTGTQERCKDHALGGAAHPGAQNRVILDVKMVSVRTGITLWNYRRLFRALSTPSETKRTEYFTIFTNGTTEPNLCMNNAHDSNPLAVTVQPGSPSVRNSSLSDKASFKTTVAGERSSNDTLRHAAQLAASEFIELLVYMQAVSPSEKRVALHAPPRPKEAQDQVSSGCATVAAWVKSGQLKAAPFEYSKNCRK